MFSLFFKIYVPRHTSQVNADVVDMVRISDGQSVRFGGSTKSVGRFISTKAVGSDERHDITHQYKYPEGSGYTNTHTGFNPNTAHLNGLLLLHHLLLSYVRGRAFLLVVCSCLYLSCSPTGHFLSKNDILGKLTTQLHDSSVHFDVFQAQRRRGRCMRRPNTTTSFSSEEKSRGSKSRCFYHCSHKIKTHQTQQTKHFY